MINPFKRRKSAVEKKAAVEPPKQPGVNYTESSYVPPAVAAMAGFLEDAHGTAVGFRDKAVVQKIYTDFKWKLRIALRSWKEVETLLNECIARCELEIQTPETRQMAIDGFTKMVTTLKDEIKKRQTPSEDSGPEDDLPQVCPLCCHQAIEQHTALPGEICSACRDHILGEEPHDDDKP